MASVATSELGFPQRVLSVVHEVPDLGRTRTLPRAAAPARDLGIEIVVCGLLQAGEQATAWRDLASLALERNPFYEPDFALAAARHLREAPRPVFVFLWDAARPRGTAGALLGVVPIVLPRFGFATLEVFGWRHDHAVLGVPLLDRDRAYPVLLAFFDWLADAMPQAGGMLFPSLPEDGPTAAVLRAVAAGEGRAVHRFDPHRRAVLKAGESAEALLARALRPKRLKEYARQRRRLADAGAVSLESATDPTAIRDACEVFLTMEAAGWKGRNGSAFVQSASGATFVRALTRDMARQGGCRIDLLRAGDVPVAAAIVLQAGDRAMYWKTTYDERFAASSPGVQLTLELTRLQLGRPDIAVTDSCAVADHPMIDALWPARAAMADWLVTLRGRNSPATLAVTMRERARRGLRETARRIVRQVRAD